MSDPLTSDRPFTPVKEAAVFFAKGVGKRDDSVAVKLGPFRVSSLPDESVERKLEAGGSKEVLIEPVPIWQRADKASQTSHLQIYEGDNKTLSICVGKPEDHKNRQSKAEGTKETALSSSKNREEQLQFVESEYSYCQTAKAALSIISRYEESTDDDNVTEDDQTIFDEVKGAAIPIWQRIAKPDNDDGQSNPWEVCYLTKGEAALLATERAIFESWKQRWSDKYLQLLEEDIELATELPCEYGEALGGAVQLLRKQQALIKELQTENKQQKEMLVKAENSKHVDDNGTLSSISSFESEAS
ncbi:hypothetical protein [Endozoicomonas elysicola]|uniref:Uncharacterized protein n=1 Tax=Endozoicomonas elysicola TaxID=305900 RepID=A0A081KBD3_9GAMM|nr:hypothetical protein [Endozoicomonas elysicola]KEI71459.1 hypothetical protein GV64_12540 [Endozoicomonas elysicola]